MTRSELPAKDKAFILWEGEYFYWVSNICKEILSVLLKKRKHALVKKYHKMERRKTKGI